MKEFSLGIEAPIDGIYLNSETIELLSIIQCKNIGELKQFAISCSQLGISEQDISKWDEVDLEDKKRELFEEYKNTLISMKESIEARRSVLKSTLEHAGIPESETDSYITAFQQDGYDGVKQKLQAEHPEEYVRFAENQHRFIATERDQLKSVTYEEVSEINNQLPNHNTILVASGRYYDVTNKLYNDKIEDMEKYDFYYAKRGLDFCTKNGMNARYHTLLDKQTMEEHFNGKSKEEIISELQAYVEKSIDFISEYNNEHQIDGKGVISSVDLFNEIISFEPPYINMWQELYGISTEELMRVFQYAQEHKPEGVTYVYNEPFLENPERRKAVIDLLKQMNEINPDLIDTIGTQMHIEMTQDVDAVKQCFEDLKKLEELGIRTQITEFDMCLPERLMFDGQGKIDNRYSPEFIYKFKEQKMQEIANAIRETGIQLEGVTYWSISDILDHNLERTNRKTFEQGLQREVAQTRYAGLYSQPARVQENTHSSSILQSAVQVTEVSTRSGEINKEARIIREEKQPTMTKNEQTNNLDEDDSHESK